MNENEMPLKGSAMFEYLVTTTDGHQITIITAGDPTEHPALAYRIYSVYTVGEVYPSRVSDPSAKV